MLSNSGLEAAVHMIAVQKSYRLLDVKGKSIMIKKI